MPRHLEIIFEINRRFLDDVRRRYPGDEEPVGRLSLIEEGSEKKVRIANLAIVGSHSTNGVAAIHSELLRSVTVKDLAVMFPERFNNKTNGITPRRRLLPANSELSGAMTDAIGDGWRTDFESVAHIQTVRERRRFSERVSQGEARRQIQVRRLAQVQLRRDGRPGQHIRLPDQTDSRIQTAAAQCAEDYRSLQPADGISAA